MEGSAFERHTCLAAVHAPIIQQVFMVQPLQAWHHPQALGDSSEQSR